MRHTIPQAVLLVFAFACSAAAPALAQSGAPRDDPFAARRWHFEVQAQGALEAWNYNTSHEQLYGIQEAVTYGLRDGLVLKATQTISYVSQRANDSWLLGLTVGLRGRVYRRGPVSGFLEFQAGVSDAAIAAPPHGTRFNYFVTGAGGAVVRLRSRTSLVTSLQWIHVSNNSLKGPGRNPDIEAIGLTIGLLLGL
jgi:hypothetical protein